MAGGREIKVSLLGDARSLERAFARAGSSGSKFGSGMGHVGHGITTLAKTMGVAGIAVIGLGAAIGGKLVQDMARQQAKSVQTNAVIASTGRVAGVTRKHVEDLATTIQNKSGIDDQAVQSGENMLLTFTNIRNEAGKGNKIFDQSTRTLIDMSTALGQDVPKSAIQLGKALNDPVKGITALQRVGVTFTEDQKKQIDAMVKSGNVMGAQKLILHELNREFGGSAAAAGQALPGQLNILKGRLMDLGSTLLSAALPALQKLTKGAIEVVQAIQTHMPQIKAAWAQYGAPVFAAIIVAGQKVVSWTRENWPQIKATIKAVIDWIATNIVPTVRSVVNNMIALWQKFGSRIMAVVKPFLEGLRAIIQGVLAAIRGDWGAVWENIKTLVSKGFQMLKGIFSLQVSVLGSIGKKLGGALIDGISALPGMLASVAVRALRALTDKLLSFHVSIKTKSYLGVPFPVGMSVGFDGGGGSTSGPTFSFPAPGGITGGLAPQGGGKGADKTKSFLNGNLDKVTTTGGTTTKSYTRGGVTYTPHDSGGGGGGGGAGGGGGSSAADKAKKKLEDLAAAAQKTRDIVVGALDKAFGKVGDYALKAFDGATSKSLQGLQDKASRAAENIQSKLDATLRSIADTQAALTPAEQALKDLQAGHDQAGRNADLASAQEAWRNAATPEEAAAAQKSIDDALYNQRVFDLGVQAAGERLLADQKAADDAKAAQDKAVADQKAVQSKLAQDTLNMQAARELQRGALENQLEDFKAILEKHPKAWKKVHAKVMGLFSDDFGPDFETAGVNIGNAYVKGLASAFANVEPLVGKAQAGVDKSNKANSRIPHLAAGGIITRPTVALIGEAGPEAVIPLGRGGMGAGQTVHIDMRGMDADPGAITRRMAWDIRLAARGA